MERDRLGRLRRPGQERGLRPLHPRLPGRWASKAVRVAMSQGDWDRFTSLVDSVAADGEAESLARAQGEVIRRLMDAARVAPAPAPLDWMDWERQKTLRLLHARMNVIQPAPPPAPLDWMDWERQKALRLLRVRPAV